MLNAPMSATSVTVPLSFTLYKPVGVLASNPYAVPACVWM